MKIKMKINKNNIYIYIYTEKKYHTNNNIIS